MERKLDPIEVKYRAAREKMINALTVEDYIAAEISFSELNGYKDSEELMQSCRNKANYMIELNAIQQQEWNEKYVELRTGRTKNRILVLTVIASLIILLIFLLTVDNSTPTL